MTRSTHHKNPLDNDADHEEEDKLPGIVTPLVISSLGFFAILSITHS
jgi:hypothetical protein